MRRNFIKSLLIGTGMVLLTSSSFAADKAAANASAKMMWKCGTNASSASNDADKKADDSMKNDAGKSAKDAFNFALQHCRDCTKITCESESK